MTTSHIAPCPLDLSPEQVAQFHYRSATSCIAARDEYDRVFAESDGTPASCVAAR